jgi:hypothetical protein
VLSGPSDPIDWRIHARRAGHVLAALARWPAIELRSDWTRPPGELGAEITGLFAGEPERILRPQVSNNGRTGLTLFRGEPGHG